jgi:hypothetical protein
MASEIGGLDPLHGFLKHGNYVVRLRVPYLQLEAHHEKFIERKINPPTPVEVPPTSEPPRNPSGEQNGMGQQHFYE